MLLEYEVGNFSDGEAYLDRLLEVMRLTAPGPAYEYAFPAMSIPMVARISGNLSWTDEADKAAGHVLSSSSVTPMVAAMTSTGLAMLAVQRGDVSAAQKLYAANEPPKTFGGLGPQVNRTIGLLAQTAGSVNEAIGHFEDALAYCRKAGFRPELAWTCHDYAEALHQRNGPGDLDKALSLINESLETSTDLGMPPLMNRAAAVQQRLESQPATTLSYPDGLTQREVEVLRLVAVGRTDREIAGQLIIGVRTVGTHVGNILNKTGAANRTEAASYAHTHGLVGPNSEVDE